MAKLAFLAHADPFAGVVWQPQRYRWWQGILPIVLRTSSTWLYLLLIQADRRVACLWTVIMACGIMKMNCNI